MTTERARNMMLSILREEHGVALCEVTRDDVLDQEEKRFYIVQIDRRRGQVYDCLEEDHPREGGAWFSSITGAGVDYVAHAMRFEEASRRYEGIIESASAPRGGKLWALREAVRFVENHNSSYGGKWADWEDGEYILEYFDVDPGKGGSLSREDVTAALDNAISTNGLSLPADLRRLELQVLGKKEEIDHKEDGLCSQSM
jgi:hypothetical protein